MMPATTTEMTTGWPAHLKAVAEALGQQDVTAALRAWNTACLAALGSTSWESMFAVGEAARRIGAASGLTLAFAARARQAYQVALFRAHQQRCVDGVLRSAEGFAALGDGDAVEQCRRLAARLAERGRPADVRTG